MRDFKFIFLKGKPGMAPSSGERMPEGKTGKLGKKEGLSELDAELVTGLKAKSPEVITNMEARDALVNFLNDAVKKYPGWVVEKRGQKVILYGKDRTFHVEMVIEGDAENGYSYKINERPGYVIMRSIFDEVFVGRQPWEGDVKRIEDLRCVREIADHAVQIVRVKKALDECEKSSKPCSPIYGSGFIDVSKYFRDALREKVPKGIIFTEGGDGFSIGYRKSSKEEKKHCGRINFDERRDKAIYFGVNLKSGYNYKFYPGDSRPAFEETARMIVDHVVPREVEGYISGKYKGAQLEGY